MIIKEITYKDFNGDEHTEKCYFHLNKIERLRMGAKYPGGIAEWAQKQAESNVALPIIEAVEEIIQMAYGVRSEDGVSFIKNPELTKKFAESEAYSELVSSLLELDDKGEPTELMTFLKGIIGSDV